ncbi:MAG: hypothetical protein WCC53_10870 [Thermoanaerobaculia bacterium]
MNPPARSEDGVSFFRTPAGIASVVAVFLLGIGLRVGNLGSVASRSPDERVYTWQARVVLAEGPGGIRSLVETYLRNPDLRFYPPPTRAGYIRLLAAVMRVSRTTDERAGAYLSCAASIGSLALLLLFGFRFLPAPATLAAAILFAVSPMELALSRRTWQDALVEFLGFSLVYLAAEISRDGGRPAWLVAYVLVGSLGIVVKEIAPVAYALVTLQVLYVLVVRRRDLKGSVLLAVAGLAGAAAAVGWLAAAVGGLSTLWGIVSGIPAANAANVYAIQYQTGPAWRVLQAFWVVSPVASLLCLAGLAGLLLARLRLLSTLESLGPEGLETGWWIGAFLLCFLALPMLLPHWINLRYVSVIYGPFYLLAGIGVWSILELATRVSGLNRRAVTAAVFAVIVLAAAADVRFFRKIFVERGLPDLSIRFLLETTGRAEPNGR